MTLKEFKDLEDPAKGADGAQEPGKQADAYNFNDN